MSTGKKRKRKGDREGRSITDKQFDAIKEAGNIGAGNAGIALSKLVDKKVNLSVPTATLLPLTDIPELVGGPEAPVAGVYLRIRGDVSGSILLLLEKESALSLAGLMVTEEMAREDEELVWRSALQETGSILSGAYINALGQLTGLFFKPSVPGLAVDMAGAIMDHVLVDMATTEDIVLVVETDFQVSGQEILGHLILFPDLGSLTTILERLGVPFE